MTTAARLRAGRYAAMAPDGADVKVTGDDADHLVQVVIKGSIDTILITVSSRPGRTRSRVTATTWFNSGGGKTRPINVGYLPHTIRSLYIDRRDAER